MELRSWLFGTSVQLIFNTILLLGTSAVGAFPYTSVPRQHSHLQLSKSGIKWPASHASRSVVNHSNM